MHRSALSSRYPVDGVAAQYEVDADSRCDSITIGSTLMIIRLGIFMPNQRSVK